MFKKGMKFTVKYPFYMDYDNYGDCFFSGVRHDSDGKALADGIGELSMCIISVVKTPGGMTDRIVTLNRFTDPNGNKSRRWVKMATVKKFETFIKNGCGVAYELVLE